MLVLPCAVSNAEVDEPSVFASIFTIGVIISVSGIEDSNFNSKNYARVERLAAQHTAFPTIHILLILPSASAISVQGAAFSSAGRSLSRYEPLRVCAVSDIMINFSEHRDELLGRIVFRASNTELTFFC